MPLDFSGLVTRASKSPAPSAPTGGALSGAEYDGNNAVLQTAIQQAYDESVKVADASPIADLEGAVADTDEFIGLRSGVPYKAPMTELPGGAMAAADIRDALETLTGANRLDASAIQNLPATGYDSAEEVRDALATLTGANRLDAAAIKNLPTLSPGDPVTVTHDGAGEDPVVGDTLTAAFATGWSGSVQWLRDGSPISGATSATYLLVEADEGAQVAPEVTGLEFVAPAVTVAAPAATAPAAFTSGQWTATAGTEQIAVDITALPSDGGSAITELQYRLDGGSPVAFSGTGTGVRNITGLTGGVEYDVEIRAVNAVGAGAWSDLKARTPSAAAGGPLGLVGTPVKSGAYGDVLNITIPAVGNGNSLIILAVNATEDTRVDGATEDTDGELMLYANIGHAFHIDNITDARTTVTLRTFNGGGSPAADTTEYVIFEVDASAIAPASTPASSAVESNGTALNQAYTTTVDDAAGFIMSNLSNAAAPVAGGGWSGVGGSSYIPAGYNMDVGAAGAKTCGLTIDAARNRGMMVVTYARA